MYKEILEKPFLNAEDICKLFDVKIGKAYKIMKEVKEAENVDETRIPKRGLIPTFAIVNYYHLRKRG